MRRYQKLTLINDGLRLDHESYEDASHTATIGISTLLLMKSIASRMDIPRGLIKSSAPNPREVGIRSAGIDRHQNTGELSDHLNLSMKIETIVSIKEMEEVTVGEQIQG